MQKWIYCLTLFFSYLPTHLFSQNSVSVSTQANGSLLIKNGNAGIIIPSQTNIKKTDSFLAPIQSFVLADGTITDTSPNYIHSIPQPSAATVKLIRSDDLVTCILNYTYKSGAKYSCTITIRKNSKSIVFEEDSDADLNYEIQLTKGAYFDQGRYRGWNSTSPQSGYEPDGRQYRDENNRYPVDATIDIDYNQPAVYPFLSNWDPAGGEVNTGRYWQLYRKAGPSSDNLFGIYQGRPSRLIGNKFVGVRFIKKTKASNRTDLLALQMEIVKRGPDNSFFPRKRFQWCAYISTKKDLLPPNQFQPIGIEMNKVSGVAAKVELYCTKPLQLNESFLEGAIYQNEKVIQQMISRVKSDGKYYSYLLKISPSFKPILDTWRYSDSASSMKRNLIRGYENLKKELISGDGAHTFYLKYWLGSINYKRAVMQITAVFADHSIPVSTIEKSKMIELLRLMARLQWDDDYVPFFDSSGINFGTNNMSYQYRNNGRNFFALLFSGDPEFKNRAARVLDETRKDLLSSIAQNGISDASPHYTQATIDPILYNMLQLKTSGMGDLFREQKTRLKQFIGFYTSLLTPPSVRFMGYRKLVSIGDGSEESAPSFALLAAGLKDVDLPLSSSLYHIFENGAPRESLFGELGLAIEMDSHAGNFKTGSASFPGYLSHARSAFNSPAESAAWIINGEIYNDHRKDDRGESIIYALGAPLSLSSSSFYSPRVSDARTRSLVMPEKLFPSWKGNNQPISGEDKLGNPWNKSTVTNFDKYPYSTNSVSQISRDKTVWIRQFVLIHVHPEEPIFVFFDSLNQRDPAIWSMQFMSEDIIENGTVQVKPTPRVYNNNSRKELPTAVGEKQLKSGWNSFMFTGQKWKLHPSGGINWDLYTYTPTISSYSSSQWSSTWQNILEQEEFLATNGRPYEETQQIIRWKSNQPFFAVIVPYNKKKISDLLKQTKLTPNSIELSNSLRKYIITPWYYLAEENSGRRLITVLSDKPVDWSGYRFSGGSIDLETEAQTIKVRISGRSGTRRIEFPFKVFANTKAKEITVTTTAKTIVEIKFESDLHIGPDEQGYKEYLFTRN
jgi:hypothetical protein